MIKCPECAGSGRDFERVPYMGWHTVGKCVRCEGHGELETPIRDYQKVLVDYAPVANPYVPLDMITDMGDQLLGAAATADLFSEIERQGNRVARVVMHPLIYHRFMCFMGFVCDTSSATSSATTLWGAPIVRDPNLEDDVVAVVGDFGYDEIPPDATVIVAAIFRALPLDDS